MPEDRFEVCKTFEIRQLSTRNGASKKVEERLYVPKHREAKFSTTHWLKPMGL
jgi:hypothetical protein